MDWQRGEYVISTDPARLDLDVVYGFLSASYWAKGIPRETLQRSLEHSLNFGLYHEREAAPAHREAGSLAQQMIGFARVISDRATVAYLGDVFVLEAWRGRGLSLWLMETIVAHPELQGLRRWILLTRDAHRLYEKVGFTSLAAPERWMERWDRDPYAR